MEGMIILSIILLVGAAIAGYFFVVFYKKYTLITKTETSNISWLQDGFCEIKGRIVSLGEQFISPFSEKPCVYYHFKVEQKKSSGKSSHYVSIIDDKKYQKFGIDDGTGIAVIDLEKADILIKVDKKDSSGFFDRADENQQRVLNKYNQTSRWFLFEKTLRYTEKYLEVGDELYVLGEAQGREQSRPVIRKGTFPLFVSDKLENELVSYYRNRLIFISVIMVIIIGLAFLMLKDFGF